MPSIEKIVRWFFLGLFLLAAGGCAHQQEVRVRQETRMQQEVRVSLEPGAGTRDATFEPFADRMVGDVKLAAHMEARLARLTGNLTPVWSEGEDGRLLGLNAADRERNLVYGWAIRLTEDGYFLTAAHILDKAPDPLYLLEWSSGEMRVSPVRVVWNLWDGLETEDVDELIPADAAIIHVLLESPHTVEWAWDWELRPGVDLVAPGGTDFARPNLSAGRLLSLAPGLKGYGRAWASGEVGTIVLRHNAHMGKGDSGSPVFLLNGALAGMTIGGGTASIESEDPSGEEDERVPVAVAVRPDADSLAQIIRRDRRRVAAENGDR